MKLFALFAVIASLLLSTQAFAATSDTEGFDVLFNNAMKTSATMKKPTVVKKVVTKKPVKKIIIKKKVPTTGAKQ